MHQYYNESVNLHVATLDSITHFCDKFGTYVTIHPDSRHDAYFIPTLNNLKDAAAIYGRTIQEVTITINVDPEWEGETEIHI